MNKKIILIVVIVISALALILLSMKNGPSSSGDNPLPSLPDNAPTSSRPSGSAGRSMDKIEAPDFSVKGINGETLHLSDLKGKAVLLNFWSVGCGPCRWELPDLIRLAKAMAGKPFALVAVTGDDIRMVKEYLSRNRYDLPAYLDETGEAHYKYQANVLPTTYVISPDGKVVNHVMGAANWGDQSVIDYFNNLIQRSESKQEDQKQEEK